MLGKQAKTISQPTLRRMLAYARRTRTPKRDQVIVLLSVKAGLRACEIAALEWPMVLDANGTVGDLIEIRTAIAKHQSGRRIPMHSQLKQALAKLRREQKSAEGPVIVSTRGGRMRANSIVNWFVAMFAELTLEGCSSHSGRRTFITAAARNVHRKVAACVTCRYLPAIVPLKRRSDISTGTLVRSAGSSLCFEEAGDDRHR